MIRVRLLGLVVLLAATACTSTPAAPESGLSAGPAPAVGEATVGESEVASLAAPQGADGEGASVDPAALAAKQLAPQVPVAELAAEVRDRIDTIVAVSRRTLDEVQASFDSARVHAASVFSRLAQLRVVLGEAGFTGSALGELDKLEQDAVSLNQTSEALLDDLNSQQVALEDLSDRVVDVLQQIADERPADSPNPEGASQEDAQAMASAETLPRTQLRDLDAEASAFERSDALAALASRSDKLVSGVAVLVSRLDRVERELAAVVDTGAAPGSGAGGTAITNLAAAKTDAGGGISSGANDAAPVEDDTVTPKGEIAEITTNKGTLLLQFFPDVAPNHVQNFKRLVRDGFYDGLTFHRVLPDYIIQGGCPRGDGFGGPGWQLDNEFNRRPHRRGTLSMARFAHPDSAGSQFFICLDDRPELDGKQTVFGRVINGEATLQAIETAADTDGNGTPSEPIVIQKISLRPWQQGDNETSMIAGNPVR